MKPFQELAPGLGIVQTGAGHGGDGFHAASVTELELEGYPIHAYSLQVQSLFAKGRKSGTLRDAGAILPRPEGRGLTRILIKG
jgi:hypothetical protein